MYNSNQYLHCDRCKFFISRNSPDHHGLCPGCSERLRPTRSYDMDELESKRRYFKECPRCDSIYYRPKREKCLTCRRTHIKLRRVR